MKRAPRRSTAAGLPLGLAVLLLLPGCTSTWPTPAPEITAPDFAHQDFETLAARAEREIRRADALGFLWLHTESHLAQAREAHRTGDVDRAMKLAHQALAEALLAQQQAAESARVQPAFTPRR